MAKKTTDSPRSIISEIKKGKYAPVYLLSGPEAYYLDLITSWLEKNVVPDDDKDFDFEVFYGADASVDQVVSSAQQLPVIGPRRCVILKEAQAMLHAKTQMTRFEGYFKNPNETTVLIIVFKGEPLPTTSKLVKSLSQSGGVAFQSPKIREYELKVPVREYLTEKGIGMDEDAVDLLISHVGNNLNKLFGEIDKLVISKQDKFSRISRGMVLENIGMNKDFNVYELRKAVADRNYGKAMQIVEYFAANKKDGPVVMVTSTLFSFFAKLTLALFCADKSDAGLLRELDLAQGWQLREYKDAMRNFNAVQAINAVARLRQLDCRSKGIGSMQDEYALLKETIFEILRP